MTSNYPEFKKYVEKKFLSMANFSAQMTGSFDRYKTLSNLEDTEDNYSWISELQETAENTEFNKKRIMISGFDRRSIKARMKHIIAKRNKEYENLFDDMRVRKWSKYKAVDWLNENRISHSYYSAVIHGTHQRKNAAFENLWTKLGL